MPGQLAFKQAKFFFNIRHVTEVAVVQQGNSPVAVILMIFNCIMTCCRRFSLTFNKLQKLAGIVSKRRNLDAFVTKPGCRRYFRSYYGVCVFFHMKHLLLKKLENLFFMKPENYYLL